MSFLTHRLNRLLVIPLLTLPLAVCGPAEEASTEGAAPPNVLITINRGNRSVVVDDSAYGPGQHRPDIKFPDPDLASLEIGRGANLRTVSMDGEGLQQIHIDASTQRPTTLVFGNYMSLSPSAPGAVAAKNWECIWCGEVLVCGVTPKCSGGGGPDSVSAPQ